MTADESRTPELLRRWHQGDRSALDALIEQELTWMRAHTRKRLGPLLRAKGETQDYVQDAMIEVLRYGPRFVTTDRARFRALLAQMIENTLRDRHDWHVAEKRSPARERPGRSTVLDLDHPCDSRTPSQHAMREEREAWAELAVELLDPEDRRIVRMRNWEECSFAEIGAELGIKEDAARMRFNRALSRLSGKLLELRGSEA